MKNTIEVIINGLTNEKNEEVIALLSSINYDAFEESNFELKAFIEEENFSSDALMEILNLYSVSYTSSIIQQQNWNELWETNFQPVIVENFCAVRASFHQPFEKIKYEIVITPKMSFGTGHHATTYMMMSTMSKLNFIGKRVADFGTGTGILAILAAKMGSNEIWAVDNDDWSIENSLENIKINNCKNVKVEKVDAFIPTEKFDIVLANINKNIIIENSSKLAKSLNDDGILLLSGLLINDEQDIINAFNFHGINHLNTIEKDNWICLMLKLTSEIKEGLAILFFMRYFCLF